MIDILIQKLLSYNFKMWSFFDRIVCINLLSRDDRYIHSQQVFRSIHLNSVNFHRVSKHPKGGKYGCFDSHLSIIRQAYNDDCDNCLIFEDDAEPTSYLNELTVTKCVNFMKENNDWLIFYLGIYPDITSQRCQIVQPNIVRLHSLMTHAYVVSRRGIELIRKWTYAQQAIDEMYLNLNSCYGHYPSLFVQSNYGSDIGNDHSYYTNVQQLYENYMYYVNVPFVTIGLILLILILIFAIIMISKLNL